MILKIIKMNSFAYACPYNKSVIFFFLRTLQLPGISTVSANVTSFGQILFNVCQNISRKKI